MTTGWWSKTWTGADIQPGNELLADNGDGTWTLTVDLTGDPEFIGLLYEQHLLFTGSGSGRTTVPSAKPTGTASTASAWKAAT